MGLKRAINNRPYKDTVNVTNNKNISAGNMRAFCLMQLTKSTAVVRNSLRTTWGTGVRAVNIPNEMNKNGFKRAVEDVRPYDTTSN